MKNLTQEARAALIARAGRVDMRGTAQQAFERVLRRHRAVGGAMSLVRGGRVEQTLTAGFARMKGRVPVTQQTVFRCASVSKLVLAMGVLRLCEMGALALDADVGEALGFPVRNPRHPQHPITLRQLLTHTAGLCDGGQYAAGSAALPEMLSRAENYGQSAPGEAFAYSNFGAGVAGCIMECATGERLETLFERLIFTPLGVSATFAPQHVADRSQIANGYRVRPFLPARIAYDAEAVAAAERAPFDPMRDYTIAPGRMLCRSAELARIACLLLSRDGLGVLRPQSLLELRTVQDGRGSVAHAGRSLGAAFLDDVYVPGRLWGHQGVAYGMCAQAWGDPETGDGVVFQTNGARLSRGGTLMHVGADALALGFGLLRR